MKRNLAIAAVTAAVLIGGGTYTAVATGGGDRSDADGMVRAASAERTDDRSRTTASAPGSPTATATAVPRSPAGASGLTAAEAAAAALDRHPGAVASVERDDRGWEVELLGGDGTWRELRVDPASGAVRADGGRHHDEDDDRDDRSALRAATVDVREAAAAALGSVPGTVTSADLDDDRNTAWDVDVRGDDGRTHELNVHARTAAVTVDRDDDHDDRGDDRDRGDDHDDDRRGGDDD